MKSLKTLAVAAATAALFSGCSTIMFTNDAQPAMAEYSQWHHNVALSLYELSEPVETEKYCDEWARITTERSIVNALAGSVSYNLWDPWTVSINCAK